MTSISVILSFAIILSSYSSSDSSIHAASASPSSRVGSYNAFTDFKMQKPLTSVTIDTGFTFWEGLQNADTYVN